MLTVGYPELLSIDQNGTMAGNSYSGMELQSLSADGKYQVFASDATNLVANDLNNRRDIFLKDLDNGAITLISRTSTGESANGWSQEPVISADGFYVAYVSSATNLDVTGVNSTNFNLQIYRWNRLTGQTVLVSQNGIGSDGANNYCNLPAISGDGSRIAYTSNATDIVSGFWDSNGQVDVFLRDFRSPTPTSIVVSRSVNPNQSANGYSYNHKISEDGSRVVYQSSATDIEAGVWDVNNTGYETVVFQVATQTNSIVSLETPTTTSGNGQSDKTRLSLSADGRYQVFESFASDLVPGDLNQNYDVFLRDLATGTTTLVSRNTAGGSADAASSQPVISADGNYVAFRSNAATLDVTGPRSTNYWSQVYRWNRLTGEIVLVSVNAAGDNGGAYDSLTATISGDGQRIAFESYATDLLPGIVDANAASDVYLRDFVGGAPTTILVSRTASDPNVAGNRPSVTPRMNRDGSRVVYASYAQDLDADTSDVNGVGGLDLVIFDIAASSNALLSVESDAPSSGNNVSERTDQSLSADGRYEVFASWASDLVTNDTNNSPDVFLKDLETGVITLISRNTSGYSANYGSSSPSISADGQYVVFSSIATNLDVTGVNSVNGYSQIYRWHRPTGQIVLVSVNALNDGSANNASDYATISGDGERIAFLTHATDLVSGVSDTNNNLDVYLRDFSIPTTATRLVSRSLAHPLVASDGASWKSRISRDGSQVAYLNSGANLDSVIDGNGTQWDLFAYDVASGANTAINLIPSGVATSNQGVLDRFDLSDNGSIIAFSTSANDLYPGDMDSIYDIYARDLSVPFSGLELVSVSSVAVKGTGNSESPSVSGDGSLVAFQSYSELDPIDNNLNGYRSDIYVRNRTNATTHLITPNSSSTSGGNYDSYAPRISSNGAVVAFVSYATDLVSGFVDVNGGAADLFAYNGTGNSLISVKAEYSFTGRSGILPEFDISNDGKTIAYATDSIGIVADSITGTHVYIRDVTNAANPFSERISVDDSGNSSLGYSAIPSISGDGRYVAFESGLMLDSKDDGSNYYDIYVRDRNAGDTELISVNASGFNAGNSQSMRPAISSDGMAVAFESYATNLDANVTDTNSNVDVFVRYWKNATPITKMASRRDAVAESPNGYSQFPRLSDDGEKVVYVTTAMNLLSSIPDVNGNSGDLFLFDGSSNRLVTVKGSGKFTGNAGWAGQYDVSATGLQIAFYTNALGLVPFYAPGWQVYLRDYATDPNGVTELLSYDASGNPGANSSQNPSISADGSIVAFESAAVLDPIDGTNGWPWDIYIRDCNASDSVLISVNSAGTNGGNNFSYDPRINREGTTVVWSSYASDLDANVVDGNTDSDVFYRKWTAPDAKTDLLSRDSYGTASAAGYSTRALVSASGTTAVFMSRAANLTVHSDTNGVDDVFAVRAAAIDIQAMTSPTLEADSTTTSYVFEVTRSWMTASDFTVKWQVVPFGPYTVNASDFGGTLPEGIVSFSAGEIQKTITVLVSGDLDVEWNETFAVQLYDSTNSSQILASAAIGTILDNDIDLVIDPVQSGDAEGNSGSTPYEFIVRRLGYVGIATDVSWATSGQSLSPADAADFGGAFPAGIIHFGIGETERTITLNVNGDALVERDEVFAVTLSNPSPNAEILVDSVTNTIVNDDSATIAMVGTTAGEATGQLNFTVTITNPVDTAVGVHFSTLATGTAVAGTDYTSITNQSVIFPAGSTATQTVSVAVLDDLWVEADETVHAQISGLVASGRDVGILAADGVGTIVNDDIVKVVNRKIYYRGSSFDLSGGVNAAIDPTKVIAQSGASPQALTFANLINTIHGINGLVFDVAGLEATSLSPSDFAFRMSPAGGFDQSVNPPSSWGLAPNPAAIDVFPGTATTPARVRLDWNDDAIVNRWLQIKILANANTGLTTSQVYYIGHLLGETNGAIEGNAFRVRGTDTAPLVASINPGISVPVENVYDINKDGRIRGTDSAPAVAMVGAVLTRITIPSSGSGEEGEGSVGGRLSAIPEVNPIRSIVAEMNRTEIRSKLTDEVFTVYPLRSIDEHQSIAADATGAWSKTQSRCVESDEVYIDGLNSSHLLSLDEYFQRLRRLS